MKNSINWFEIPVTNIATAATFYEAVVGRALKQEVFFGTPHAIFTAPEPGVAGTLIEDAKRKPARTGTVVYLDAPGGVAPCLARAVEAGAKVVQPRTPIGPFGEIALIEDLDGNIVGLHAETKGAW